MAVAGAGGQAGAYMNKNGVGASASGSAGA